jgi:hypothetical protein
VHDLGDGQERRIAVEPERVHQRLERAAVAFVCELRVEHVEAKLP